MRSNGAIAAIQPQVTTPKSKGNSNMSEQEKIVYLPLSAVWADARWNIRTTAHLMVEKPDTSLLGDTPNTTIDNLAESIEATGQDTPVIVRPIGDVKYAKPKGDFAHALVTGFRRHAAFTKLNADAEKAKKKGTIVPGVQNGFIKAIVRSLNDEEARLLNIRENTGREQLTTPEQLHAVQHAAAMGLKQEQIAASLCITQAWVSNLLNLGTKLHPNVLKHWAEGGSIGEGKEAVEAGPCSLAFRKMVGVSKLDADRQVEEYLLLLKGDEVRDEKTGKKAKKWWAAQLGAAERAGTLLAKIAKTELVFDAGEFNDWAALIESGAMFSIHKEVNKPSQFRQLAARAEKAYQAELEREDEEEEEEDEAAE